MRNRYVVLILSASILLSLYIRIALPYDSIFTGEWLKFSSIDAYWQMSQVDKIAPVFPEYITQIFKTPFFVWLLSGVTWCIGLGSPTQHTIDVVGAFFPAILAAITIIPVYFIGTAVFGKVAGAGAAVLIAVLPGEWLGRSVLGFTDHHVMEVLLSTTTIMFMIHALKSEGRKRIILTSFTSLFMALYLRTFLGGVLFVFIIAVYLCWQLVYNHLHHKKDLYPMVLMALGAGSAIIFFAMNPSVLGNIGYYFGAIAGNTAITTTEMRPILYPQGTFTLAVVWASFSYALILAPVAITALVYKAVKEGHSGTILLVIWCLVTLVLMLEYRRFAYYFAVNASLLMGWVIWYTWEYMRKQNVRFAVIAVAILLVTLIVPNTQNAITTAKHPAYTPPDSWCETLEWVEQNTPADSMILSWWDYGYWIERIGKRKAYVNPSQDSRLIKNTAKMFIGNNSRAVINYIIIDYATTVSKHWAIATWASRSPGEFYNYYYVMQDGNPRQVLLFYPEYYRGLAVHLYNFNGKTIIPTQSTVIEANGNMLVSADTFASYQEAMMNTGTNKQLVGTSPLVSPIPLDGISEYELVYTSSQTTTGIPDVKVFRLVK